MTWFLLALFTATWLISQSTIRTMGRRIDIANERIDVMQLALHKHFMTHIAESTQAPSPAVGNASKGDEG